MSPPTDEVQVDGDRAYDPKLKTWIKYKSRSDALLANLALQHSFTLNQLDLVLKVIQDQGFEKSATTMTSPAEVLHADSLRRKALESKRSRSEQVWELLEPGIPRIVLQLVVDLLMEEMANFEEDVLYYAPSNANHATPSPSHAVRQDLFRLTLVHRAWTPIVRNAFARRIILTGPKQLASFIRSAYCGTGVRELVLKIDAKFLDKTDFLDCPHLFSGLFEHTPNILSLCLKFDTDGGPGFGQLSLGDMLRRAQHWQVRDNMTAVANSAIGGMKCLKHLQRLWLISREPAPIASVAKLCDAISCLNSVRFISIAGSLDNKIAENDASDILHRLLPPRSLKTVEIRSIGRISKQLFTWLFVPSILSIDNAQTSLPTIENISIDVGDSEVFLIDNASSGAQQALLKFWSSLRSLVCNKGDLNRVQQAIPLCTNLRHLTIDTELFWQLADSVSLPKELEHLTLRCYDTQFLQVHDKAALDLLNQANGTAKSGSKNVMRRLRRLEFLLHSNSLGIYKLERLFDANEKPFYRFGYWDCMRQTSTACHALGIEFSMETFLKFGEVKRQ